jgi:hypothetical protein
MPMQNALILNMPMQNGYSHRCHQITILFFKYAIKHKKILNCPYSFFLPSHGVTKIYRFFENRQKLPVKLDRIGLPNKPARFTVHILKFLSIHKKSENDNKN